MLTRATARRAQVAAERAAWELSKEHGFKLCVINPSFVLGPVVSSRTDATSIDTMKARRPAVAKTHARAGPVTTCCNHWRLPFLLTCIIMCAHFIAQRAVVLDEARHVRLLRWQWCRDCSSADGA